MKFWQRLQRNRSEQIERDIEDELRFHLTMRAQQNRTAGMSEADAQADALARFGDYEAVKAKCRAITKEKLAHSLPRRLLNALIWTLHGVGLALRFLSDVDTVQQCGNILIVISVTWRLLLYVRLSGLLRQPVASPALPSEPLNLHNPIPHFDSQCRTPVERVLSDDE